MKNPRITNPGRINLAHHRSQQGMSLIELMVSMIIGLFLILGAVTVYVQSKANYRTANNLSRIQENVRFALNTIEPDIRLARFWGRHNNGALIQNTAGVAVFCKGTNIGPWALNLAQGIQAIDNRYDRATVPCAPKTVARPNSDILVTRHASSDPMPPAPRQPQLQVDLSHGELFNNGIPPTEGFGRSAQTYDLVINIYYIDNDSSHADPNARFLTPSLRRKTLVNGVMVDQEVMRGVENLQIQLGLDTSGSGFADLYTDPGHPIIADSTIVAVRLWMLIRAEVEEFDFHDAGPYTPPDTALPDIVPDDSDGPASLYPAAFRRLQVTKTIFLRN